MAGNEVRELRNNEISDSSLIVQFKLFPKWLPHAGNAIRFGIALTSFQLSFNLAVPLVVRIVFFFKQSGLFHASRGVSKKKASHIREISLGKKFRLGIDKYLGEAALILPLFKIWLRFEPLGRPFWEKKLFSFFYVLFKLSVFEFMFQIRVLGLCISLHLPFYEIGMIRKLKENRNRKFLESYKAQKRPQQ